MFPVFPRQKSRLVEITALAAHRYSGVEIEFQVARRFDELLQLINILEFCIAIQQKCSMV
jgi:hypothetical protein